MNENIEKINIKEAKIANEIIMLQKEAYKIEADLLNYYDLPPLKEKEVDLINSKEEFLVYKLDNKICGVISFEVTNEFIDICKLFISPNYINKGIGSKLLKRVEGQFENVKLFKVQTGLKNKPALNFYQKHNFKLVKVTRIEDLEIAEFQKFLITIRKAKEDDILEIKELLSIVWDNTYKDLIPEKIIDEIKSSWHKVENLRTQIINGNTVFNIAEENNKIVGILTAMRKDNKYYLSRLYVLPNFQRKGIGKKLLNNLIITNKVKEIELEVEEGNEKGIKFYNNEGFIKIGNNTEKIMNFELKSLIMNKKINE